MNKKLLIILSGVFAVIIACVVFVMVCLSPVSKTSDKVSFTVNPGDNKMTIVKNLKNAGVIRNDLVALAYIFFTPNINLQAGTYTLDRSDKMITIISNIAEGKIDEVIPTVKITFVEGKTFDDYARLISNNFDIEYDDIIKKCSDKEYLKKLIEEYDFLTDSILNENIYYPLEGYLAADTYEFYADASIETIIKKLLDTMGKRLSSVENDLKASKYSVHDILTIASIVEKEAVNAEDRAKVSQVIYKRLSMNMALGMDVTTYYAVHKKMGDVLTASDLASKNAYNTRNRDYTSLPVGAICNPSMQSINAALHPSDTDFTYFVADVATGKISFASSYEDFIKYKNELGLGE